MKGYYNGFSYVGWMPDRNGKCRWMFFSSDTEYREAYNEAILRIWRKAS